MVSNNLNRDEIIIRHIYEHCSQIIKNIRKEDALETFLNNQNQKDIICFNELQIGELVKLLSNEFKQTHKEILWKQIAGMRDNIVHGYTAIEFSVIWDTATNDIPNLMILCEKYKKIE